MEKITIEHKQGRLVRVPDRRERVLFVSEGETPFTITKESPGPDWMCNFYKLEKNMTVTFWLKSVVETPKDANAEIVNLPGCWVISYNSAKRVFSVSI